MSGVGRRYMMPAKGFGFSTNIFLINKKIIQGIYTYEKANKTDELYA